MSEALASADVIMPVGQRRLITGTLMLASLLQALDSTIANVALPRMQGSLSASQEQLTWVLTSYIVAAAIMTPLSGWLADRYGRKQLFLLSIIGFTITSGLCGLASSLSQIVLFRLMQGVCGAALIPISQAILFDIYPRHLHARAMSIWGMGVVIGPMLGPVLGGYLTDNYSWQWVFFINVPFGILAAVGVLTLFGPSVRQRRSFDLFGFATLSIAVGALQLMLDRGSQLDWFASREVQIEAVTAAFACYLFVTHSLTSRNPFIRMALFKDRNFVSCNIFMFLIAAIIFASMALLPSMLQGLMGYSVLDAGIVMTPRSMGSLVAMFILPTLSKYFDPRLIIAAGFALAAQSLWSMSHFSLDMSMSPLITTSITQGLGTAITYVPVAAMAFATLPVAWRNEGTAMFNLMRNVGSSVGISLVQVLLVRNIQIQHAVLASHLTPFRVAQSQASLGHPSHAPLSLPALDGMITAQATMVAYIDDFRAMFYVVLAIMPLLLLLRRPGAGTKPAAHVALE